MNMVCTTKNPLCSPSQITEAKLLKNLNADVAKLVDARDLKSLDIFDLIIEFSTTPSQNTMKSYRISSDLHNIFGASRPAFADMIRRAKAAGVNVMEIG